MTTLLNWRYYVLLALFTVGALAVSVAFSEPDAMQPDASYVPAISLSIALPSFCLLWRLMKRWARAGLIPEMITTKTE